MINQLFDVKRLGFVIALRCRLQFCDCVWDVNSGVTWAANSNVVDEWFFRRFRLLPTYRKGFEREMRVIMV
jgi:hypothetical protein